MNASQAAIRAHTASPAALAFYLNKGVRVLSSPTRHAKVITTNRRAVIDSANASVNSTFADDAVIITSVRTFIDGLDDITEVDHIFIDNAALDWAIGRAVSIPRCHWPNPQPRQRLHSLTGHSDVYQACRRIRAQPHRTAPDTRAGPGPVRQHDVLINHSQPSS